MSTRSYISLLMHALLLCLVAAPLHISAAEPARLHIDAREDPLLLPYAADILWERSLTDLQGILHHPVRVLWSTKDSLTASGLLFGYNFPSYLADPSMLIAVRWPGITIVDENPVRLLLSDLAVLPTPDSVPLTVAGTGVRNDTGFVFFYQPGEERYREHFLVAGEDRTGDGRWVGNLPIVRTVDLNRDGIAEPLIFVSASRDGAPRELMCVDPLSGNITWRLSIMSGVTTTRGIYLRDQEPRILFTTSCPGQGFTDSLFLDSYSYFVALNSDGSVATRKIVARYPEQAEMVYDDRVDQAFLYHTLEPTEDVPAAESAVTSPRLSVLSPDGTVSRTIALTEQFNPLWLHDYVPGGRRELYSLSATGVIRVFDSSLTLLAESGQSTLTGFTGYGPALPDHPITFMASDTRNFTALLSASFELLAVLPTMSYYEIIDQLQMHDSVVIAVSAPLAHISLLRLRPRPFLEYVSILFTRYRHYVLAILFSLLVGLVVVNYYRLRTRKNLDIISEQKAEIERTHEALQAAQQKIIETEKYRQAQDIAGGFAHEIRNALLPAQVAHAKLMQRHADDAETIGRAEHAVRRALDLTGLVAAYTRLDIVEHARLLTLGPLVRSTLEDFHLRFEDDQITVTVEGDESLPVHADPEHLRLLLSNLLANACDALAGRDTRTITIELDREDARARIAVTDSGSGIDPAVLLHLFNPFVSTKPRDGHGLGLSLVKRIVTLYGGEVLAENRIEGGARVTITLPLARSG